MNEPETAGTISTKSTQGCSLPVQGKALGVLRYAGSQDDPCHFDGWYYGWGHEIAIDIYAEWCELYPGWTVALVRADVINFTSPAPPLSSDP
jgi:hypothetical protein